jgi:hypothetical protein
MSFRFDAVESKLWTGPYGRIPGESAVFHVRTHSRRGQPWPLVLLNQGSDQGICWAVEGPAVHDLTKAVLKAKRFLGGGGGGEFLINEFGQVLVPSPTGDGRRAYAGRIEGRLCFENPINAGTVFDLSNDSSLECGDSWPMPYVGCQYNLAAGGWIYRTVETREGLTFPRLQRDGDYLIRSLRQVRPSGAARFIVNPCGLVLTKRHDGLKWDAVYVGRLRAGGWFDTEGGHPLNLPFQTAGKQHSGN